MIYINNSSLGSIIPETLQYALVLNYLNKLTYTPKTVAGSSRDVNYTYVVIKTII